MISTRKRIQQTQVILNELYSYILFLYSESQPVEENIPSLPSKVDDNPPIIATADKILVGIFSLILKDEEFILKD